MSDDHDNTETVDDPTSSPNRLGDLLADVVRQRQWVERLEGVGILRSWEQIVGSELVRRCRPVKLAGGVLVVEAENSAWATQLSYLEAQLLQRADEVMRPGLVRKLKLIVGPSPDGRPPATAI